MDEVFGTHTAPNLASAAELQAAMDSLADVTAIIKEGEPEKLARLYGELGIELKYDIAEEAVYATTSPRVFNVRVRGATCTLSTHLVLAEAT